MTQESPALPPRAVAASRLQTAEAATAVLVLRTDRAAPSRSLCSVITKLCREEKPDVWPVSYCLTGSWKLYYTRTPRASAPDRAESAVGGYMLYHVQEEESEGVGWPLRSRVWDGGPAGPPQPTRRPGDPLWRWPPPPPGPARHGDAEAQRGQMPHATSAGASPTPKCSRFIISGRYPGPNWSQHLVSGPSSNLRMELLFTVWPWGSISFPVRSYTSPAPTSVTVATAASLLCHLTRLKTLVRATRVIQVSQEEAKAQRGEASCPRSPSLPQAESGDNPLLRMLVRTGFQSPCERKGPMPEVPNHTEHSRPQRGPTQAGRP